MKNSLRKVDLILLAAALLFAALCGILHVALARFSPEKYEAEIAGLNAQTESVRTETLAERSETEKQLASSTGDGKSSAEKSDFDLSQAPNIIVIMNEAFSDLSVIGNFETSEDYMPFFHSMMDQYTGGHLMVSVKGGFCSKATFVLAYRFHNQISCSSGIYSTMSSIRQLKYWQSFPIPSIEIGIFFPILAIVLEVRPTLSFKSVFLVLSGKSGCFLAHLGQRGNRRRSGRYIPGHRERLLQRQPVQRPHRR